jgi:atypical dual specificity phosphatase
MWYKCSILNGRGAMLNFKEVVKDEIAAMMHPGITGNLEKSLRWLKEKDVGAIVSLEEYGLPEETIDAHGFEYTHIPIKDFHTPTKGQVGLFIGFVDTMVSQKILTAVHCFLGVGRTGTMIGCYLVARKHMDRERACIVADSLSLMEMLPTQKDFILSYKPEVASLSPSDAPS